MIIWASSVAVVSPLLRLLEAMAVASSEVTAPRPMARTNMATISSIRLLPCCDALRFLCCWIFMMCSKLHSIPCTAAVIPFANAARGAHGDRFPRRGRRVLEKDPEGGGASGTLADSATGGGLLGAGQAARPEGDGIAGAAITYCEGRAGW